MSKIVFAALLTVVPTAAVADSIIWDNYPSGLGVGQHTSQLDNVYGWAAQVADDFAFESPGEQWVITGLRWVGTFWNPSGSPVLGEPYDAFFYADDGTGQSPTGSGLQAPETTAIRQYELLYPTETPLGDDRYECEVDLPEPFTVDTGVKYWIAIRWRAPFPPQWGLVSSADSWGASARQGFPLLSMPYWTGDLGVDVAFKLIGYQVPEPGGAVLMACLLLIVGGRSRH